MHTPGPWHRNIRPATRYPTIYAGDAPNHVHVAHLATRGIDAETAEANCDLITQAPAMLAALQWLLDDMTDAGEHADPATGTVYDSVANARAVLIAAGGTVHQPTKPTANE